MNHDYILIIVIVLSILIVIIIITSSMLQLTVLLYHSPVLDCSTVVSAVNVMINNNANQ